jgi:hypothetical protein
MILITDTVACVLDVLHAELRLLGTPTKFSERIVEENIFCVDFYLVFKRKTFS